ncbi:Rid family detoxifying hydrolase [Paenarthrobacter nicotinovorans]|uniref:Rid family detoxifying hydrolase n=1 Tax=Paenarthrobacter nicotinovorans TaxID=29320 RepID=UPI0024852865|nr:Rid family detoxifying hydrolase [Paenarthrobacter nicotinovorans]MDI2019764.1 2-iminobutanoate/2-iminopropanoate deaminase [Paenarthrobacter nicotinovorans]
MPAISSLRAIATSAAPAAIGPYSQAVAHGNLLFVSGQLPIDPATDEIVEGGIAEQTSRVLDNIEAILSSEGLSFRDVVKTTVLLMDLGEFPVVNAIYAKRFTDGVLPARATFQVAGLPKNSLIEIEAIALAGSHVANDLESDALGPRRGS